MLNNKGESQQNIKRKHKEKMQGPTTAITTVIIDDYLTEPSCSKMASSTTVRELIQRINEDYWSGPDQCVLKCHIKGKKKYLLNEDALICQFADGQQLKIQVLVTKDRDFGFSGLNSEQIKALKVKKINNAKSVNKVKPGSNLHHLCGNSKCQAFGRSIKVPKNFGTLSIGKHLVEKCPLCFETLLAPTNIGFYKCKVKIEGKKSDDTPYNFSAVFADDLYHQFSQVSKESLSQWQYIKVIAEKL